MQREHGASSAAKSSARTKSPGRAAASAEPDVHSGATKADLMAKARTKNIRGRSRMSRDELEKAVA